MSSLYISHDAPYCPPKPRRGFQPLTTV
jgi:hypothetical protein